MRNSKNDAHFIHEIAYVRECTKQTWLRYCYKNRSKWIYNNSMYCPYPASFMFDFGIKRKAAELIQYRKPPDDKGPSLNTWPKWESAFWLRTSIRCIWWDQSAFSLIILRWMGFEKAGHPQPEWNLSRDKKRGSPLTTST